MIDYFCLVAEYSKHAAATLAHQVGRIGASLTGDEEGAWGASSTRMPCRSKHRRAQIAVAPRALLIAI